MKKNKPLLILCILGGLLLFSSCDKNDPALTKTQLLTQHKWVLDATATGFIGLGTELSFNTDKTYTAEFPTFSDGGKWEFSADETKLLLDRGIVIISYQIVKLDENNLQLKELTPGAGDNTITYIKK